MSDRADHDATESDATLDEVLRELAQMARDQAKIKAENAQLAARLERLEREVPGSVGRSADPGPGSGRVPTPHPDPDPDADASASNGQARGGEALDHGDVAEDGSGISRRSAFKALGAAAAAGAGVALGAGLLGADPVAAAPVQYVRLASTNASTAETSITTVAGNGFLGSTSDATAAGLGGQDTSTTGGMGVMAASTNGLGLVGQGGRAPLRLLPSTALGPPTAGDHARGEVFVDVFGDFFVCSNPGTPGTWQRVTPAAPGYNNNEPGSIGLSGSVNLLSAPIRVFDSRQTGAANPSDPSRPAGPVPALSTTDLQIAGATVGSVSIPAGIVGVIGNVTAVGPAGGGWLTLFPTGGAQPLVSSLNFQSGDAARGNFCVVGLSGTGKLSVFNEVQTDVVFDVAGFLYGAAPISV
jgi:hypothetical protein